MGLTHMSRSERRLRALLLLSLGLLLAAAPARAVEPTPAAESWQVVREEDGITSSKSERAGRPLPAYRASAVLEGSAWEALAVLDAVDVACEWTSHCAEMRRVQTYSARDLVVYARMDAPWPVHDRDVLVRVQIAYGAPGELFVTIRDQVALSLPAIPGVVRMPHFSARYRFRTVGERTELEYQLEFDPGGALPGWLKGMVARNLAHDTLDDLRKRVRWAHERQVYRDKARSIEEMAEHTGYRR